MRVVAAPSLVVFVACFASTLMDGVRCWSSSNWSPSRQRCCRNSRRIKLSRPPSLHRVGGGDGHTSVVMTRMAAAHRYGGGRVDDDVDGAASSSSPATTTTVYSRRDAIVRASSLLVGAVVAAGTGTLANPASSRAASTAVPSPAEIERLPRGHARVRYLIDHWDDLTSVCGKGVMSDLERKQVIRTEGGGGGGGVGGNVCEKTPLRVQEFLGYKSTTDPLFKADKLMFRAAPLVDPDRFEDYLDVVERYREKADQGAMMAYTSSWGEANPNGGKEVVDEYLERTKVEVVETEKLLRQVLGYLDLQPLPPLEGPL